MVRSTEEWIASHDDQAIPPRVKVRIFDRYGGRCAKTGVKLRPGHYQFDHIVSLGNGGEHREGNLQPLCTDAHKVKTTSDRTTQKKTDRMHKKHIGAWPKSPFQFANRPFPRRGETR